VRGFRHQRRRREHIAYHVRLGNGRRLKGDPVDLGPAFVDIDDADFVGDIGGTLLGQDIEAAGGYIGGSGVFGAGPTGAMLSAAASNVAGQGINMVIGQQKQFSWTRLAVSAISAPIAQAVGGKLTGEGGVFAKSDPALQALVKSTTSALVSAVTHLAIQGGKLQ